jgi:23S rRNA (cytidine1920-2'-O)/16S rRNA (cytidine1409-2'-O)-methyltransferase
VGYGQLAWSLQSDDRVRIHDRTNIRDLDLELIGGPVDVVVGDLSFISLRLVLGALLGVVKDDADLALMVKPQFEVGKDRVGKGGVVRDVDLRIEAVAQVSSDAAARGWGAQAVTTSPLPGPSGNIEYFLWFRKADPTVTLDAISAEVRRTAELSPPGEKVGP